MNAIIKTAKHEIEQIESRVAGDLKKLKILRDLVVEYEKDENPVTAPIVAGEEFQLVPPLKQSRTGRIIDYIIKEDRFLKGEEIVKALNLGTAIPAPNIMNDTKRSGRIKSYKVDGLNKPAYWGLIEWFDGEEPNADYMKKIKADKAAS